RRFCDILVMRRFLFGEWVCYSYHIKESSFFEPDGLTSIVTLQSKTEKLKEADAKPNILCYNKGDTVSLGLI
ncbi:hypothetical protein AB3331_08875, partial [Streptococcus sp. H49]|uniref:hypothetical protein n=1 Tax=Streptococcus huangxiaojuni TaxID=3237239 RepID=UPI0034A262D6